MSVPVWAVVVMLFGHWVFDFVLQSEWMALNKSSNWDALAQHVAIVSLGCWLTAGVIQVLAGKFDIIDVTTFALINGVAHFGIDAVTSRIAGRRYVTGDRHGFFVTIGFDQFLHVALATWTLGWLLV